MICIAGEPEIRELNYYSDSDEEFHGFDSDDEASDVTDYGNPNGLSSLQERDTKLVTS